MYGKLIDGVLKLAPKNYIKDNKTICNFNKSIELLTREGYKEVMLNKPDYDKSTHICRVSGYEDRDDYIECVYVLEEREINRYQSDLPLYASHSITASREVEGDTDNE